MKWKCHNCGNIFESEDDCEEDEYLEHAYHCFDLADFFEVLHNQEVRKR